VAHAATKRELVAKQRPPNWAPPRIFRRPEVLTEVKVNEAEAELKALQRHALEVVDPETGILTWLGCPFSRQGFGLLQYILYSSPL
jgi:hypothetical protein